MAQLVLGLWAATAFVGAYMFTFTLGVARSRAEGAVDGRLPTRLPPMVLFVHPLLGITGLGLWIAYIAADQQELAWATLAVLLAGSALGDLLVVRTLREKSGKELLAETRIPTAAIATHGVLAVALIGAVFLVCLGIGDPPADDDRGMTLGDPRSVSLLTPGGAA
jgi:hypothetical protein